MLAEWGEMARGGIPKKGVYMTQQVYQPQHLRLMLLGLRQRQ
jgi:hypothetical protein